MKGSVFTLHMSGVLFHVNLRRSRFSVLFLLEEKCFGFMWPFCLFKFVLRSDAFTSARQGLTRGEPVSNKDFLFPLTQPHIQLAHHNLLIGQQIITKVTPMTQCMLTLITGTETYNSIQVPPPLLRVTLTKERCREAICSVTLNAAAAPY